MPRGDVAFVATSRPTLIDFFGQPIALATHCPGHRNLSCFRAMPILRTWHPHRCISSLVKGDVVSRSGSQPKSALEKQAIPHGPRASKAQDPITSRQRAVFLHVLDFFEADGDKAHHHRDKPRVVQSTQSHVEQDAVHVTLGRPEKHRGQSEPGDLREEDDG